MVSTFVEKTTLYLSRSLQARLRESARLTGRSQAEVVRDALERHLEEQPLPRLGVIGIGDDPELDARDSEAWLAREWGRG